MSEHPASPLAASLAALAAELRTRAAGLPAVRAPEALFLLALVQMVETLIRLANNWHATRPEKSRRRAAAARASARHPARAPITPSNGTGTPGPAAPGFHLRPRIPSRPRPPPWPPRAQPRATLRPANPRI